MIHLQPVHEGISPQVPCRTGYRRVRYGCNATLYTGWSMLLFFIVVMRITTQSIATTNSWCMIPRHAVDRVRTSSTTTTLALISFQKTSRRKGTFHVNKNQDYPDRPQWRQHSLYRRRISQQQQFRLHSS